jgi:hypothetical protein
MCHVVERRGDHVRLLYDLLDGMTLDQEIVASSVLPITEILTIEDHKLNNTFLQATFGSQSMLELISDQTDSDTNWRIKEVDQRGGMNESQLKFLDGTWPMSPNQPNASLF